MRILTLLFLYSVSLVAAAGNSTEIAEAVVEDVLAVSNDAAYGEYLAGECAACHAVDAADQSQGGAVPRIHGADASFLVRALLEYRSGARSNTTMGNVASALSDEEIAVLAHYLASLDGASE